MPHLFGRPIPAGEPVICQKLGALTDDNCAVDGAISENLSSDARVSEVRSASFIQSCGDPNTTVKSDLGGYANEIAHDQFQDEQLNDKNLIHVGTEENSVPPDLEVVTIQKIFDKWQQLLTDWLAGQGITQIANEWLVEAQKFKLEQIPVEFQTSLAESHALLPERRPRVRWVGKKTEFDRLTHEKPIRWLEVFGLGHHFKRERIPQPEPSWFAILNYRVEDTKRFARPTVLEAGASEWHYYSPAAIPAIEGGRSMDLGFDRGKPFTPMTEFVHNTIRLKPNNILGVVRLDSDDYRSINLTVIRDRHSEFLNDWQSGFDS